MAFLKGFQQAYGALGGGEERDLGEALQKKSWREKTRSVVYSLKQRYHSISWRTMRCFGTKKLNTSVWQREGWIFCLTMRVMKRRWKKDVLAGGWMDGWKADRTGMIEIGGQGKMVRVRNITNEQGGTDKRMIPKSVEAGTRSNMIELTMDKGL